MARGREGVCGELGNFVGGGLNIFFLGSKCRKSKDLCHDELLRKYWDKIFCCNDVSSRGNILQCLVSRGS